MRSRLKTSMWIPRLQRHRRSSMPGLVLAVVVVAVAPAGCDGYGKTPPPLQPAPSAAGGGASC
jgi:hypothetical protein